MGFRIVYTYINNLKPANNDQKVGIDIVRSALEAPIRQIAFNAGYDASIVVGKIRDAKSKNYGFDAQNGKYVDMVAKGIIDPTKVVRAALQDAASVAGLLITTEAMIADAPEKKDDAPCIQRLALVEGGPPAGREDRAR